MESRPLVSAGLLGIAAGIRSMTPLAFVSAAAATGRWQLRKKPVSFLSDKKVALALAAAAAGEVVVDKLPFVPSRTAPPVWLWRIAMGGETGGVAGIAGDETGVIGALAGAGTAGAATYAAYRARLALQHQGRLPSPVAGLVGDALSLVLSLTAVLLTSSPRVSRFRNFLRRG